MAKIFIAIGSTSAGTCAPDANIDRESDSEEEREQMTSVIDINADNRIAENE